MRGVRRCEPPRQSVVGEAGSELQGDVEQLALELANKLARALLHLLLAVHAPEIAALAAEPHAAAVDDRGRLHGDPRDRAVHRRAADLGDADDAALDEPAGMVARDLGDELVVLGEHDTRLLAHQCSLRLVTARAPHPLTGAPELLNRAVRRTASRPCPTEPRSDPQRRTSPGSRSARCARAGAGGRAHRGRPRRSPAAPARPATAPRAGPARQGPPGRTPRRGHTRARTGSVLTGCASGTLLGSVPARFSPKKWRGHWFVRPSQSLGAAVLVGWNCCV